ncbi:DNA topoisomerase IB (plasmid) [Phyllobacterium sp. 628]|uniref:DNA topoisomerase IB n=1 Tax=Phyllobacterium sp. 628 TaxID=2718938 RepID=UPI0016627F56|nr:DNA topoisomerase IB [Phyllobacterium sp. 628]QND54401.1 DNA topoisomerase IB [Phyllobacterium sp. 628]
MQPEYREAATALGLKIVDPDTFEISRHTSSKGITYIRNSGRAVSVVLRKRFDALVIPPAWTSVRCCEEEDGHIQAVGQDDLGRRQYIYHSKWVDVRDRIKTQRLLAFGKALPLIRKRTSRAIQQKNSKASIVALAVKLVDKSVFRAGHEKYAKDGGRGIATLKKSDLKIEGNVARFVFAGKSKKKNFVVVEDKGLVRGLQTFSRRGRLFQYQTAQGWRALQATELNEYLREISGSKVSAKDFRTFHGSARALAFLAGVDAKTDTAKKRAIAAAMRDVSTFLRNTPAVTRSSYVHPLVTEAFIRNELSFSLLRGPFRKGLNMAETALMRLLERC